MSARLPPATRRALVYRDAEGSLRCAVYLEQAGVAQGWPEDVHEIVDALAPGDVVYLPVAEPGPWAVGPIVEVGDDGRLAVRFLEQIEVGPARSALRMPAAAELTAFAANRDLFAFAAVTEREAVQQSEELARSADGVFSRGDPAGAATLFLAAIGRIAAWGELLEMAATGGRTSSPNSAQDSMRVFFAGSRLQERRRQIDQRLAFVLEERRRTKSEPQPTPVPRPPASLRAWIASAGVMGLAAVIAHGFSAWMPSTPFPLGVWLGTLVLGLALGAVRWIHGQSPVWSLVYPAAIGTLAGGMAHHLAIAGGGAPVSAAILLASAGVCGWLAAVGAEPVAHLIRDVLRRSGWAMLGAPVLFGLCTNSDTPRHGPGPTWMVGWGIAIGAAFALLRPGSTDATGEGTTLPARSQTSPGPARWAFAAALATALVTVFLHPNLGWIGFAAAVICLGSIGGGLPRAGEALLQAAPAMAVPALMAAQVSSTLPGKGLWFSILGALALADLAWPRLVLRAGELLLRAGRPRVARVLFDLPMAASNAGHQRDALRRAALCCQSIGDDLGAAVRFEAAGDHRLAGEAWLHAARQLPTMPAPPMEFGGAGADSLRLEPPRLPLESCPNGGELDSKTP